MPTITLPNTFVSGAAMAAADFNENVCTPNTTPASLDVVNGQLDVDNLAAGTSIEREMLAPGEFALGLTRANNVPTDYFSEAFAGFINANRGSANEISNLEAFQPVPGSCISVDLDWAPGALLLGWSVFATNDGTDTAGTRTILRLARNGAFVDGQRRVVPPHRHSPGAADTRYPGFFQRVWSGTYLFTNLSRGRHDFGIYLAADADQSRVFSASISPLAIW